MKHVAWITGGSRGIGLATVKEFLQKDWKVIVLTRNLDPLSELKEEYGANLELVAYDLQNPMETNLPSDPVDVLIHNAGALINKPMAQMTAEDLRFCYGINVFGPYLLTQRLLPQLTDCAHVVAISSVGGVQGTVKFPGLTNYSSSKGAMNVLMECFQAEFEDTSQWAFNTLALGAVQTEMLSEAFPGYIAPLQPEELSPFIYNFASSAGQVMRGKTIPLSLSTP